MSDGIVLIGLPGSGKTTVGNAAAERLGRRFIDIDCEIERIVGRPSADVLAHDGEPRLREIERNAVLAAVGAKGAVIATGGGTVLDPLNRWLLMEHGFRVRLEAPIVRLADRLNADTTTPRPLLGGDLEGGLRQTAEARAAVYAAVDAAVDGSADVEATADAVLNARTAWSGENWRPLLDTRYSRNHPFGPADGRLVTGRGLDAGVLAAGLHDLGDGISAVIADRAALAANPRVAHAFPAERMFVLDGGEQVKTMSRLEQLLGWLSEARLERGDPLVVVGGGTVGDLGGLGAALHRRGIPLVNVPTTWLAQADSAIGGKVAIDLPNAKNGVGTFWPAWLILEDAALPSTLPVARRRDGIAECLKAGLIGDPLLWQLVEERGAAALEGDDPAAAYAMTERSARLKLEIVDRDPFETGERRQLNLGHTIGHALEIESGYLLAHGEAVALGLRAVARIAGGRGAQADLAERIDSVLTALGFDLTRRFDRQAVAAATLSDKKRTTGVQHWILPMAVGHVADVVDVSPAELDAALDVIAA
jgi:shikimate kinase / 3-dehydroquinate synthase